MLVPHDTMYRQKILRIRCSVSVSSHNHKPTQNQNLVQPIYHHSPNGSLLPAVVRSPLLEAEAAPEASRAPSSLRDSPAKKVGSRTKTYVSRTDGLMVPLPRRVKCAEPWTTEMRDLGRLPAEDRDETSGGARRGIGYQDLSRHFWRFSTQLR